MNKFITCLIITLSITQLFSQSTKEIFSTPGYENLMISIPSTADEFPDGNLSLYFEKDSLVCGESMLVYDTEHQGRIILDIIEGQVWAVHDCDNRKLVMNFDLTVGDTITHQEQLVEVLSTGDTILMDGIIRKTYSVSAPPNTSPTSELFIEGIGSIYYGINYLLPGKDYTTYLSCVNDDQGLSYHSEFVNPIICDMFTRVISFTKELSDLGLEVYPNPSNGIFTVKHLTEEPLKANVYSTLGKLVTSTNITSTSNELNLSYLSKGHYYLNLTTEDGSFEVIKLVLF